MGRITGDNRTVLVVEDSDDIRELICMQLRRLGYRVVEAANGEEALELVARNKPGLILMDLRMPVMDGYEATRRIKALPDLGGVPVVALSAFCNAYSRRKALEAGCVDVVGKPVNSGKIDTLLSKLLEVN